MSSEALVAVLTDARTLLTRPDNDFSWSRWCNQEQALAEIDELLSQINTAGTVKLLPIQMLFAPTASLQEVSVDSGWGEEFLRLASRLEDAVLTL